MKPATWIALGLLFVPSAKSLAEEWIALDDNPTVRAELDVSSIIRQGRSGFVDIRFVFLQDGATYFTHQNIAVSCGDAAMRVQSGYIASDRSPKVVIMPNLPEEDRMIHLPTPNPVFNRIYDFVCQY